MSDHTFNAFTAELEKIANSALAAKAVGAVAGTAPKKPGFFSGIVERVKSAPERFRGFMRKTKPTPDPYANQHPMIAREMRSAHKGLGGPVMKQPDPDVMAEWGHVLHNRPYVDVPTGIRGKSRRYYRQAESVKTGSVVWTAFFNELSRIGA